MFLCTSWQETRYIFECYNRNIETVAETDETRSLVRSVNIKHTCQICRLIGNDTYRTSTQTSKTDYNILCKVRHNLKEIMIVDYRFDDVFDIIWHVRVVRNNCHQWFFCTTDIICTRNRRSIFHVVRRQETQQLTNAHQSFFFCFTKEVSNTTLTAMSICTT